MQAPLPRWTPRELWRVSFPKGRKPDTQFTLGDSMASVMGRDAVRSGLEETVRQGSLVLDSSLLVKSWGN